MEAHGIRSMLYFPGGGREWRHAESGPCYISPEAGENGGTRSQVRASWGCMYVVLRVYLSGVSMASYSDDPLLQGLNKHPTSIRNM